MKREWVEAAKEFALSHGCEEDCGSLYSTAGLELYADDIYKLMAGFAIKIQSERGM